MKRSLASNRRSPQSKSSMSDCGCELEATDERSPRHDGELSQWKLHPKRTCGLLRFDRMTNRRFGVVRVGGVSCSGFAIGAFCSAMETPLVTPRSRSPVRPSLSRSRTSCPFAPRLRSCSAVTTRTARSYLANTVRHVTAPQSRLSASEV